MNKISSDIIEQANEEFWKAAMGKFPEVGSLLFRSDKAKEVLQHWINKGELSDEARIVYMASNSLPSKDRIESAVIRGIVEAEVVLKKHGCLFDSASSVVISVLESSLCEVLDHNYAKALAEKAALQERIEQEKNEYLSDLLNGEPAEKVDAINALCSMDVVIDEEIFEKLLTDEYMIVRQAALSASEPFSGAISVERATISDAQLLRAMSNEAHAVRHTAYEIYVTAMKSTYPFGMEKNDVREKALKDEHPNIRIFGIDGIDFGELNLEQIQVALLDDDEKVRSFAVSDCSLSEAQLSNALSDDSALVRCAAISHHPLEASQMDDALQNEEKSVVLTALSYGNANPRQLSQLMNKFIEGPIYALARDKGKEIKTDADKMIEHGWNKYGVEIDEFNVAHYLTGKYPDGKCIGKALEVDLEKDMVLQSLGRGRAMLHALSDFKFRPLKGEVIDVSYTSNTLTATTKSLASEVSR